MAYLLCVRTPGWPSCCVRKDTWAWSWSRWGKPWMQESVSSKKQCRGRRKILNPNHRIISILLYHRFVGERVTTYMCTASSLLAPTPPYITVHFASPCYALSFQAVCSTHCTMPQFTWWHEITAISYDTWMWSSTHRMSLSPPGAIDQNNDTASRKGPGLQWLKPGGSLHVCLYRVLLLSRPLYSSMQTTITLASLSTGSRSKLCRFL